MSSGCRILWALFLFALLVRVLAIAGTVGFHTPAAAEPSADSRIHAALVQSLLTGRGFSMDGIATAATPPLYIFLLGGLYAVARDPAAVRFTQAILGAVCCLMLYAIGRKCFDHMTGLVAAGLLAFSPLVVYLTGLHLTENLFLVLLLLVLAQSIRVAERPTLGAAAGLGALIGLAALTRAVFLAFLPFIVVWEGTLWGMRSSLFFRIAAATTAAAFAVILPWTIRNYLALGAVVPVQSNAGMVFWAGNNAHATGGLVWPTRETWDGGKPPDDGAYGWRGTGPAETNRRYVNAALRWIETHPRPYLRLLAGKLAHLYGFSRGEDGRPLPVPRAVILFHALVLCAAAAGLALTIRRWRSISLLVLLILFTNIMSLLFSGGTRYTIPMVPSMLLFAAAALVRLGMQTIGTPAPVRRPVGA